MRRRQIAIGLLGVLLAAVPLAGVHLLVGWHTREQGTDITSELAAQVIGRVDSAIDEGLVALTELSMLGVHSCGDSELDLMRRAVYANYALKDVAITDDKGNVVCNHIGDRSSMRATSESVPSRNGKIRLTPVELGTSGRFGLMLTLALPNGGGLSAIVPGEVIATDVLPTNLRDTSVGVLTLSGGVRVATMPTTTTVEPPAEPDASIFTARTYSARYPLNFALFVPYDAIWEETRPLRVWANIGAALMSLIIAGTFLQLMRRGPNEMNEIRVGIERSEFIPYYQPVVDIQTGRLMGCEVLIRWRKPDGTIVLPGAFIQLAEATGLALPMTLLLMQKARDELNEVYGMRPHLKLSINLFDDHFENLRIVKDVESIFGKSRIAYRQLMFEVTERQPLANLDRARIVIRRLQDLGSRVALDDAGTGHGGLAYLQELGMDVIKIDKLFIDTIGTDRISAPIVDSLIKLAQDLGMEVVAEGVERFDQVQYLRMRGVQAAQGYLFAPALPGPSFIQLIQVMDPIERPDGASTEAISAERRIAALVA